MDVHKKKISYCVKDVSAGFTQKALSQRRGWTWTFR
jgi:hypothetical protein